MSASEMVPASWTDEQWASHLNDLRYDIVRGADSFQPLPSCLSPDLLAQTIDHTLLKLDADEDGIDQICEEAKKYHFKTVCVRLPFIGRCRANLNGTNVGIACVVGFHEGTYSTEEKQKEAKEAIAAGATELDIVLNHPLLSTAAETSGQTPPYSRIFTELAAIRSATSKPQATTLKLILETSQLPTTQIVAASIIAWYAGFEYIKTSTGFSGHGATEEHVRLMSTVCDRMSKQGSRQKMLVKASGGIRDYLTARRMIESGASRLGVSAGVAIVSGAAAAKDNKIDQNVVTSPTTAAGGGDGY